MQNFDGSELPDTENLSMAVKFNGWFDDNLTKEINDKDITVMVFKAKDERYFIHLATEDTDLINRVQKVFLGYSY